MERREEAAAGGTTWFLPPERAEPAHLLHQVAVAVGSPVIDTLLRNWSGAIAVLNSHRQVLAVNAAYLQLLGFSDPGKVLGLRPGETVGCAHAEENLPGGCGTSRACRSCGAAISIVAALARGGPEERDCSIALTRGGVRSDVDFRVRAHALELDYDRFVLLSLTDVSADRRRAAIERAFFHDVANLVTGIVGACDAASSPDVAEAAAAAADARQLAVELMQELRLQRSLGAALPTDYRLRVEEVRLGDVVRSLQRLFARHPVAAGKRLELAGEPDGLRIATDRHLLQRVVTNMLVNAFEATPEGAAVRLAVEPSKDRVAFSVTNPGVIPPDVAPRIFQRYFSTKGGEGRGHGTFVIKHFGEQWLRGTVWFTTTEGEGTTFALSVPRALAPGGPAVP